MWGGVFGLSYVENERWGGLTLTLLLSTFGIALAFPLSILLGARAALGHAAGSLAVHCLHRVDSRRAVDLGAVHGSVMLPLFLPAGVSIDKLLRAQVAMILFAAAYLAEVVRGGLQAIPRQQEEAAQALGHRLLAADLVRHPAASAADRDSAVGQYVYRLFQGHLPRRDHRAVRFSDDHQGFPYRAGLERLRRRSLFCLQPLVTSSSVIRCRVTAGVLNGIPRPAERFTCLGRIETRVGRTTIG